MQQSRESEEDFEVTADRTLNYEDGSARLMGVRISVKQARRPRLRRDRRRKPGPARIARTSTLKGSVVLEASDGFRLTTDDATYDDGPGLVNAPGRVAFTKGGLSGSGLG